MEGLIPPGIHQILEVSAATHMLLANSRDRNMAAHSNAEKRLYKIEERVIALNVDQYRLFDDVNGKMDNLLQKMDAAGPRTQHCTNPTAHPGKEQQPSKWLWTP
jgi:hypothetical protein